MYLQLLLVIVVSCSWPNQVQCSDKQTILEAEAQEESGPFAVFSDQKTSDKFLVRPRLLYASVKHEAKAQEQLQQKRKQKSPRAHGTARWPQKPQPLLQRPLVRALESRQQVVVWPSTVSPPVEESKDDLQSVTFSTDINHHQSTTPSAPEREEGKKRRSPKSNKGKKLVKKVGLLASGSDIFDEIEDEFSFDGDDDEGSYTGSSSDGYSRKSRAPRYPPLNRNLLYAHGHLLYLRDFKYGGL